MQATAYESAGCHVDGHAAVLRSAEEVRVALEQGRHQVARAFAQALADWFPEHARVMDLGLARWLVQRRLGGSPVVIRPRASVPEAPLPAGPRAYFGEDSGLHAKRSPLTHVRPMQVPLWLAVAELASTQLRHPFPHT